jgi:glutamyl-tRNA synthetase
MVINWLYKLKYRGQYTLRFDDTDPKTKKPMLEAYDWYLEDCEWLGIKPDQITYMSDHVLKYYEYAEKLIDLEKAYVCTCTQTKQQENRRFGIACEHRDTKKTVNLKEWGKMLDGMYKAGQAVLKIKTDMQHKNPAVRDWVALRVLFEPHPRVGDKYKVWPMLDFAGAIEDYLNKTTHIIRGKDLRNSTERQEYMYKYLGWVYPVVNYWGRVSVEEFGKISTSGIKKGIEEGKYSGWDDPKLPTLRALRKRGIKPEAIVEFWEDMGLSERDVKASLEKLEALNQKYL